MSPVAHPQAIVSGPNYRFTVLTNRLVRYEWAPDGLFEDRASTFAINRYFPVPRFRLLDGDDVQIITEHFHLSYNKKRFTPGGVSRPLELRPHRMGRPVAVRDL